MLSGAHYLQVIELLIQLLALCIYTAGRLLLVVVYFDLKLYNRFKSIEIVSISTRGRRGRAGRSHVAEIHRRVLEDGLHELRQWVLHVNSLDFEVMKKEIDFNQFAQDVARYIRGWGCWASWFQLRDLFSCVKGFSEYRSKLQCLSAF